MPQIPEPRQCRGSNVRKVRCDRFFDLRWTLVFAVASEPQHVEAPYPSMAPIEQYLMEGGGETSLARSAAPEAVSRDAAVLLLERHGYETAVEGRNGLVCVVERARMADFDSSEFWNPKIRPAVRLNASAAPSILPITFVRRTPSRLSCKRMLR